MEAEPASSAPAETAITVRYWAAARAAAGVESESVTALEPLSLAALVGALVARHGDARLAQVLGVCSVLIGDRPAGGGDRAGVIVAPGDRVEFLPPFAGG